MNESNELLPFVKPETIAAIQADPFAMQALEATRDFLYLAHRDFSRLTEDGKMIFNEDEAGIAWAALGELMAAGPDDLPSDTTVRVGGVCMNIDSIHRLQQALQGGRKELTHEESAK
jgi:hypothetical protein